MNFWKKIKAVITKTAKSETAGGFRQWLLFLIECGLLVTIVCYACETNKLRIATDSLVNAATAEIKESKKTRKATEDNTAVAKELLGVQKDYTEVAKELLEVQKDYTEETHKLRLNTEKDTEQRKRQFDLSIEPQIYGALYTRDRYLTWFNKETGSSIEEGQDTSEEIEAKEICESCYYIKVENPTQNMALNTTAFVYYGIAGGISRSLQMRNYIRPRRFSFFIILDKLFNTEEIRTTLLQLYPEKDTALILDSGYLAPKGNKPYLVIIYKDLLGNLYVTKTTYRIFTPDFGKSHLRPEKIERFKLGRPD